MPRLLSTLLIAALLSACASKPDEAPERTEAEQYREARESMESNNYVTAVDRLKAVQIGHPLGDGTQMGPVVSEVQHKRVLGYLEKGTAAGAETVLEGGATQVEGCAGGHYVKPALLAGSLDNVAAREEIFGPVLSVIGFTSFDDAMQIANDTIYGLAAAVWTSDLSKAHRAARTLRAGSVWVNQYDGGDMTAPFGGFKQSGNGRDKSLHAFDKYTELKATWIKL